jgi:hypothetical protein
MDPNIIPKLLDQGLLGILLAIAIFAIVSLYKKVLELQDSRVKDSKETNNTVSVALHAVTDGMENMGNTMKSILITLEKKNDKS